jgi:hypothetical protein
MWLFLRSSRRMRAISASPISFTVGTALLRLRSPPLSASISSRSFASASFFVSPSRRPEVRAGPSLRCGRRPSGVRQRAHQQPSLPMYRVPVPYSRLSPMTRSIVNHRCSRSWSAIHASSEERRNRQNFPRRIAGISLRRARCLTV